MSLSRFVHRLERAEHVADRGPTRKTPTKFDFTALADEELARLCDLLGGVIVFNGIEAPLGVLRRGVDPVQPVERTPEVEAEIEALLNAVIVREDRDADDELARDAHRAV